MKKLFDFIFPLHFVFYYWNANEPTDKRMGMRCEPNQDEIFKKKTPLSRYIIDLQILFLHLNVFFTRFEIVCRPLQVQLQPDQSCLWAGMGAIDTN